MSPSRVKEKEKAEMDVKVVQTDLMMEHLDQMGGMRLSGQSKSGASNYGNRGLSK